MPPEARRGGWERLVPHSDALSVQLVRYDDRLVTGWRLGEGVRGGGRGVWKHDPSGVAGDLDAEQEQQKKHLKR